MAIIKRVEIFCVCERCKHEWLPKLGPEDVTICPKCKSPYWNKPKKKLK